MIILTRQKQLHSKKSSRRSQVKTGECVSAVKPLVRGIAYAAGELNPAPLTRTRRPRKFYSVLIEPLCYAKLVCIFKEGPSRRFRGGAGELNAAVAEIFRRPRRAFLRAVSLAWKSQRWLMARDKTRRRNMEFSWWDRIGIEIEGNVRCAFYEWETLVLINSSVLW